MLDDSLSMKHHWEDVISLFSVVAYFVKRLNPKGIEMYFTVSQNMETFKDTTPAISQLRKIRLSAHSHIDIRLEQILIRYLSSLKHQTDHKESFWSRPKAVKPLSLYIFIDAAWQSCDAVPPIEAMIEGLS